MNRTWMKASIAAAALLAGRGAGAVGGGQRAVALQSEPAASAQGSEAGQACPSPAPKHAGAEWNSTVNESTEAGTIDRGTIENSDVDDRDMPGESFNITHSTDYNAAG